jgi:hypothetical protein
MTLDQEFFGCLHDLGAEEKAIGEGDRRRRSEKAIGEGEMPGRLRRL